MKYLFTSVLLTLAGVIFGQNSVISGLLFDQQDESIAYSNVALYNQLDSTLVKVETTDEDGKFKIENLKSGTYYIVASYIGLNDLKLSDLEIGSDGFLDLGKQSMTVSSVELETAIVSARRAMVEVKPDRTVFNVQGTINSTGDTGLELLRKAPGVLVDNNNNITVLSRTGVLIYLDGKRLPLTGQDLSNYLQNLTADQIDRIDIITNPGAKYEAQGNAGIIDIRLKKDEKHGGNGSLGTSITKANLWKQGLNGSANFRNKTLNTFGQFNLFHDRSKQEMVFTDFQNSIVIQNIIESINNQKSGNLRWGTDFFISKNHTIGFLASALIKNSNGQDDSDNFISSMATPNMIDSILIADNTSKSDFNSQTLNFNYVFQLDETSLNIDIDYAKFKNEADFNQPNSYFASDQTTLLTEVNTAYTTPVKIDILTFKVDYSANLGGGQFGIGSKLSKIKTDNTYKFFDIPVLERVINDRKSNQFVYDENVYAIYVSYNKQLSDHWQFSSGLRMEQTDARGDLTPFAADLKEPPVELDYLNAFPSAGLTYTLDPENVFSINYGRRINRPDYNVLNPFKFQLNELSFSKGNPFLKPEIVNNFELGYLMDYRYNAKLAYSRTTDQITRLIGPDDADARARFINWDNLAEQIVYSLNISAPIEINNWWNAYVTLTGSHIDNRADYGDGVTVDVQAWSYNLFQQHTFNMPNEFTGEVSSWFSGPGVWGGVFKYDTSWALNLGLQRKFFQDKLNVKLSVQDIFEQAFWSGYSEFNGLRSEGMGKWDSQRVSLNLSYNFGNSKVKSRKRNTGIEDEAGRVK